MIAGDTLFRSSCEDIIDRLIRGVQRVKQSGLSCDALLTYYETSTSDVSRRGIVEVEKVDLAVKSGWNEISSVTRFLEKPAPSETGSRLAVPALYLFDTTCFSLLNSFLELHRALPLCERDAPGKFVKWLCSSLIGASGSRKVAVRCLSVPGRFDVGNLADYLTTRAHFAQDRRVSVLQWGKGKVDAICAQTWARVGLMGNPSDGFHGRTLAMTVKNFYAEVRLNPGGEGSRQIVFLPHPRHDRVDFSSREVLESHVYRETYGGGMRLLKAACITFFEFCQGRKLVLKEEGFSLQYRTNIPRQVGLGGSSAIITSTLRCLFRHFALSIGPADLSSLALRVEMKELGIQAGLQDRVVQAYEGLVYMDFDKQHMEQHGHGIYKVLPEGVVKRLPVFLLVWLGKPSNSGRIHSNVRKRYDQGCKMVMDAMSTFGSYAGMCFFCYHSLSFLYMMMIDDFMDIFMMMMMVIFFCEIEKAEQILMDEEIAKDKVQDEFLELMNKNFGLRVQLYGRLCVGDDNIKMVEMLRKYGVAAKFPGSGGAVLGALPPAFERLEELRGELADCGYKSCILEYVSE